MPAIKEYNFEEARLIGIIAEQEVPQDLKKSINAALSKKTGGFVCLPFRVERPYLKNVLACMQLMDVEGLVLAGSLRKGMNQYVKMDESARQKGLVNVIKKVNRKFVGYYIEENTGFARQVVALLTRTGG
jgi:hypothetical protein